MLLLAALASPGRAFSPVPFVSLQASSLGSQRPITCRLPGSPSPSFALAGERLAGRGVQLSMADGEGGSVTRGSATSRRRIGSSGDGAAGAGGAKSKLVQMVTVALHFLRDVYGQFFVLFMDTFIQKPFLFILSKTEISNHKRLTDLIRWRPRKTPLITVSNHCSSLDEPLLFSALIPWPMLQWQLRYSLCNDNMFYVFGEVFAQLFFHAARGFPIWRSRSINQPSFRDFCFKARGGGWCHIFPEGRIWQPWKLQKEGRTLGPLRPGVGKLIATCELQAPIVLPFYHTGMHRVLPQVPGTKKQLMPPKIGNTVRVRVGEPIEVQDLLDEWRAKRKEAREAEGITDSWTTTKVDEQLYDAIVLRVEAALTKLSQEVDFEAEWQPHPSVLPFMKKAAA